MLHTSAAFLLSLVLSINAQSDFLSASNPWVLWGGRYESGPDGSVTFDWEGTTATFVVTGVDSTVTMFTNITLAAVNSARVSVYVNGYDAANLMLHNSTPTYLLASSLPLASNTITIQYAFEPGAVGPPGATCAPLAFLAFRWAMGGPLLPLHPSPGALTSLGTPLPRGACTTSSSQ
jgi:hypothetical protein